MPRCDFPDPHPEHVIRTWDTRYRCKGVESPLGIDLTPGPGAEVMDEYSFPKKECSNQEVHVRHDWLKKGIPTGNPMVEHSQWYDCGGVPSGAPDPVGVHVTHCCLRHGCRYTYLNVECSVAAGKLKQEYPCEECEDDPAPTHTLVDLATADEDVDRMLRLLYEDIHTAFRKVGLSNQSNEIWTQLRKIPHDDIMSVLYTALVYFRGDGYEVFVKADS